MENRDKESLRVVYRNVCAAERMLVSEADVVEDEGRADLMRSMARVYKLIAGWIIDEIRDSEYDVRDGGEDND